MSSPEIPEAAKNNLAFVFVPGSFSPADVFDEVARQLVLKGYEDTTLSPLLSAAPKTAQRTPPAKLSDDAFYIREVIQAYLSRGKDVVVVMNSYGGFPGTEALRGLPTRATVSRTATTGPAAIVGMVYVSSFLPFPGDTLRSVLHDYLLEDVRTGKPGGYMEMTDEAGPAVFSDLQAEGRDDDVKRQFARIITHSSDSFDGAITHDMWAPDAFQGKAVYLLGLIDPIVPPVLAKEMVDKVAGVAGQGKVKLVEIADGGHTMHITKPKVVVDVIEGLVSDLVQEQ